MDTNKSTKCNNIVSCHIISLICIYLFIYYQNNLYLCDRDCKKNTSNYLGYTLCNGSRYLYRQGACSAICH